MPPARSYTSVTESESVATRLSAVVKKARAPSSETSAKKASTAPLPPVGPVETSAVVAALS